MRNNWIIFSCNQTPLTSVIIRLGIMFQTMVDSELVSAVKVM